MRFSKMGTGILIRIIVLMTLFMLSESTPENFKQFLFGLSLLPVVGPVIRNLQIENSIE
jgi:hypothetical protein